jgi:imidazolonepropionase-like amidohydrolase
MLGPSLFLERPVRCKSLLGSLVVFVSTTALAQVPAADLATPPADAKHYVIQSTAGKHGDSWLWKTADGTRMGRETLTLRGQVFELDVKGRPGADGMPASLEVRGFTPTGDAGETFSIAAGQARWKSQVDAGSTAYRAPAFYSALNGPIENTAWAVDAILAQPDKTLPLLPGGKARAEKLTTITVGQGASRKEITAWAITGVSTSPVPVWADADNRFFALSFFLSWLPEEYAGEHDRITQAQTQALSEQAPALRKALLSTPRGAVAFTNVQIFDAEAKKFVAGQNVVVTDGRITAVGPAKSVQVPAGAQVFDGRGKTLVPGLWDCHLHIANDYTGLQALSMGVTSIRDPGNDDDLTADRRNRAAAGKLLLPNVYASSLIDGKGENTAQVANVANSQAEAVALVGEAKKKGFVGVKFYGTLDKTWLAAAAAEAHRLGLHVHGHIPAGMRPLAAIDAGYDEITHINWVVMQAMPDEVIAKSNGILRFEGPGRFMKDTVLDSGPIKTMIDTMAGKGIYSDPTMVAFESLYVPENGDLSPSYAPFVGTMPPSVERGFRIGGFKVPEGLTRADYRASWAKMVQVVGRMHRAGVPIVAGTDGFGIELVHELEIYVEAGMTPAEALATATIIPARLVGQEKNTGSIVVGKVADLVLVEGDPSKRIGDLRQTRTVLLGGNLLDADALRAAAGFSGRPK